MKFWKICSLHFVEQYKIAIFIGKQNVMSVISYGLTLHPVLYVSYIPNIYVYRVNAKKNFL